MNTFTTGVSLYFINSTTAQAYISVLLNKISRFTIKELTVSNASDSSVDIPVGILKSDLTTFNQSLASLTLIEDTSYNIQLNSSFAPTSSVISGNYNFYLNQNDQNAITGDNIDIYVNLLIEFTSA